MRMELIFSYKMTQDIEPRRHSCSAPCVITGLAHNRTLMYAYAFHPIFCPPPPRLRRPGPQSGVKVEGFITAEMGGDDLNIMVVEGEDSIAAVEGEVCINAVVKGKDFMASAGL